MILSRTAGGKRTLALSGSALFTPKAGGRKLPATKGPAPTGKPLVFIVLLVTVIKILSDLKVKKVAS
jgi:hypothetical protein